MLVVDTNVLVDAANADSPFHAASNAFLERQRPRSDAWFSTWPILYEFLRVTTHRRALRKPWPAARAWEFVAGLLAAPGFSVLTQTSRHAEVAREVLAETPHLSGNIIHDVHTAILMREHGIRRICTRDADFHRFGFVEVVDPVSL
ncbi:MAG: type II toxin-antitoxin system VapC family toxin [Pseudomonadota bacterium]